MATLFISSLPFRADEDFIRNLFSPFGKVISVTLHADWVNPTFEPYAHVDLETANLQQAILDLDGKKFGQHHIRVHERVIVPNSNLRPG